MKTFSPGLSDSIASMVAEPPSCPHCDSSSHVVGGLCVGCLLQAGLNPGEDCDPEALVSAFAEINLPDQNWRLGNYEILEEIGRGGMGVIYRARQRHSRRIVAVKRVLSYHSDSRETLARFRREAQAAASLDHPNILPIYEVSESEDGLPFFSMKFAPGGSLQEVGSALRNDPRRCVALVAKIARAVQYAHGKGILHRDLKPGNILLDARGEPLVSDFGLAKWLDTTSDLTRTLTIFGTPGYIAPEQASGSVAQLKPAADVYSLGAILFDLLAGRPPFLGAHALSVIRQAAELPAPKLRSLSKIADRDLETICARCLERDPKLRYPSAHDLAEDLERWLEGRSIVARPVPPAVALWRWTKRNQVLAGTIAACFTLASAMAWRQIRNQQLEAAASEQLLAFHSIAISTFRDLDTANSDKRIARDLLEALRTEISKKGQVRLTLNDETDQARLGTTRLPRTRLEGTRRIDNGLVRISLRVVDITDNAVIYHRVFKGNSARDIATQIAGDIYSVLDTRDFSPLKRWEADPGWRDSKVRELIVAGRVLLDQRTALSFDRAIACFEKAVHAQPNSALAHSYLAIAQASRTFLVENANYLQASEASATRALKLNSEAAEAYNALAIVRFHQGRFQEALQQFFAAAELTGGDSRLFNRAAEAFRVLGQPVRALAWYRLAESNSTRPGWNQAIIGDCLVDLIEDEAAAAAYRRYSELVPDLPEGWIGLCRLALLQKNFDLARALFKENALRYREFVYSEQIGAQVEFFSRNFSEAERLYQQLYEKDPSGGGRYLGAVSYRSALARLRMDRDPHGAQGMLQEALQQELALSKVSPHDAETLYRLSAITSSLGATDDAIQYLRQAFAAGVIDYRSLALDPRFDALRTDPQYDEIFRAMVTHVASLRTATSQPSND
jgi:tetratricopeptide (TPR) repeat protein/tRNA A-37 threonylcarbamoyl transferase component Bud32/TolB-like protein